MTKRNEIKLSKFWNIAKNTWKISLSCLYLRKNCPQDLPKYYIYSSTYDFKVFSTKLPFPVVWLDFPLLAHSLAALKFESGFTFAFTSILKVTVVLQLYWNWSIFSQIRANKVPLYSLNGHMYHVQPVHSHGFSSLPI